MDRSKAFKMAISNAIEIWNDSISLIDPLLGYIYLNGASIGLFSYVEHIALKVSGI